MERQRFKIWVGNNQELSIKVQEKLFDLGYRWYDKSIKINTNRGIRCFYINGFTNDKDKISWGAENTYEDFLTNKSEYAKIMEINVYDFLEVIYEIY